MNMPLELQKLENLEFFEIPFDALPSSEKEKPCTTLPLLFMFMDEATLERMAAQYLVKFYKANTGIQTHTVILFEYPTAARPGSDCKAYILVHFIHSDTNKFVEVGTHCRLHYIEANKPEIKAQKLQDFWELGQYTYGIIYLTFNKEAELLLPRVRWVYCQEPAGKGKWKFVELATDIERAPHRFAAYQKT